MPGTWRRWVSSVNIVDTICLAIFNVQRIISSRSGNGAPDPSGFFARGRGGVFLRLTATRR